jgi:glycosyltransferase involved in cell wall biosynthesis
MGRTERIAFFLATSGHSGVDRAMQNLIPELAARGYLIDVLQVRGHGPYLKNLAAGITVHKLPSTHVYSSFFHLQRYLSKYQPDVLFADKDRVNRTAFLAHFLARSKAHIVVRLGTTISVNLSHRSFSERIVQKASIRYLYPLAYRFIVSSRGLARDVGSYLGHTFANLQVVPPPVIDNDLFSKDFPVPNHRWFKNKKQPIIVSAGELSSRKDFSTLLKAFSIVRKEIACRLVILGEGKHRKRLQELAQKLRIQNDFDLPGFQEEPYAYMAHADLFAFSSRWEGLGFVLIEALAVGTPVISTDCPSGPREILDNGRFGPLVPVGDAANMAQAILKTLQHPHSPEFLQQAAQPYEIKGSADAHLHAMGLV